MFVVDTGGRRVGYGKQWKRRVGYLQFQLPYRIYVKGGQAVDIGEEWQGDN